MYGVGQNIRLRIAFELGSVVVLLSEDRPELISGEYDSVIFCRLPVSFRKLINLAWFFELGDRFYDQRQVAKNLAL